MSGLALFFKETVFFALLFMLIRRAQKKHGVIETMFSIAVAGIFLILYLNTLGLDLGVYFHKYALGLSEYASDKWNVIWWIKTMVVAFSPLVAFFPFGITSIKRRGALLECLVLLLPVSFIWPVMSMRFSFCVYPCVIPSIVCGLNKFLSKFKNQNMKLLVYLTFIAIVVYNNYKVMELFGLLPILHS